MNYIKSIFKVTRKEYITPHYIRVYLTGEDVKNIAENTTIGINNKIFIPPKNKPVYFTEYDMSTLEWGKIAEDIQPTVRTYTHRGVNLKTNEIWIDFVAHGDKSPASGWAIHCKNGDELGILMKNRKIQVYKKAENYVLIGDATAIPVLGAILEDLSQTTRGICMIEVQTKEDEQNLQTKANIEFIWLHNPYPEKGSKLSEKLKTIELPRQNRYAHVAAESESVKKIRNYLLKEKQWDSKEIKAVSYWKIGKSETEKGKEDLSKTQATIFKNLGKVLKIFGKEKLFKTKKD